MRISINEDYFRNTPSRRLSQKESLSLIKKGGFDTVDFGMFPYVLKTSEKERIAYMNEHREHCESLGISVNQAHAPFFEGKPMPENYVNRLLECVDDCKTLGAEVLVVHADTWYCENYVQWNIEDVTDTVYEVYAPVVERAERLGIKIAMETLFEYLGSPGHRTRLCSFTEELDAIIKRMGSDSVGACWDFGHTAMAYKGEQFDAMRRLESKIISTHVHDNIYKYDSHNLPYQGNICWDEGMRTMAELGYEGDLTLEVGYGALPAELSVKFLEYSHLVAEHLVNIFNTYSKNFK